MLTMTSSSSKYFTSSSSVIHLLKIGGLHELTPYWKYHMYKDANKVTFVQRYMGVWSWKQPQIVFHLCHSRGAWPNIDYQDILCIIVHIDYLSPSSKPLKSLGLDLIHSHGVEFCRNSSDCRISARNGGNTHFSPIFLESTLSISYHQQ